MAKILLVEDDLTFSQMLRGFLHKHGHSVQSSQNTKEGLKFAEKETFDLLLLDYRLPDGTGLDLLKKVRENGQTTPAIIMTSFNDVRTAVNAIRSGALAKQPGYTPITWEQRADRLVGILRSLPRTAALWRRRRAHCSGSEA